MNRSHHTYTELGLDIVTYKPVSDRELQFLVDITFTTYVCNGCGNHYKWN